MLGSSDPKLAAAVVTCPGILSSALDVNSLLSNLLGGTQTAAPATGPVQQGFGTPQVTALAGCLAKALL
jgi:hypothetical protein